MTTAPIDLPAVIDSLPRDHVVVLRGALAGFAAEDLARLAGVPTEALLPLLRLAAVKLDRALAEAARAGPSGPRRRGSQ